ncbi:MAG: acyltransferase family protein, partial [Terriglobales bacterium]
MARPGWLPQHIPSLDGLRGLAIALVLLHHCAPRLGPLGLGAEADWGWIGVNLFFVLSGFLITGILLDEREQPHLFRNFYVRRGLRIWPLYFLVVPLVYFTFGPHANWRGAEPGWPYFLIYIQNLAPGLTGSLYPTWSLAIEEQFYLVWAPLVRWIPTRVLGVLLLAVLGSGAGLRGHWLGALTPINTLFHLDGLAAGCLVALAVRWWPGSGLRWRAGGGVAAVVGLGASVAAAMADPPMLNTCLAIGFAGVLLVAASAPGVRGLSWRPLRQLGKISYGVYLIHMPIFALLGSFDVYMDRIQAGAAGDAAIVALRLVVTLAVATLLWHGFERPLLGLKRYFRAPLIAGAPRGYA